MKETDAQALVVKAVRNAGGAAHKLSNRFLIGVADLLVKLPDWKLDRPALLAECKLQQVGRTTSDEHEFKLDVTRPQLEFLSSYSAAGMCCGVLSFVERGGLGRRGLSVAWFDLDRLLLTRYRVQVGEHIKVPLAIEGEVEIVQLLREVG